MNNSNWDLKSKLFSPNNFALIVSLQVSVLTREAPKGNFLSGSLIFTKREPASLATFYDGTELLLLIFIPIVSRGLVIP